MSDRAAFLLACACIAFLVVGFGTMFLDFIPAIHEFNNAVHELTVKAWSVVVMVSCPSLFIAFVIAQLRNAHAARLANTKYNIEKMAKGVWKVDKSIVIVNDTAQTEDTFYWIGK